MDNAILEMTGIDIAFPGAKALDNVDFTLRAGEVHALLGENGAGKSTLIKCLTGVYHKDAGKIIYLGNEIHPSTPQTAVDMGISTVYQEINLCPNLTVAENIFIGRQPMRGGRIHWKEINRRAEELLARFHLSLDVTRPLSYYSTAIQQMVSIVRAVDVEAKILILDEPTSSLDQSEVAELFRAMRKLRDEGLGIIFITHFLDQVYEISDRITVLRNGRLVGEYPIGEITKLELVTRMIGKDIDEIYNLRRSGFESDRVVLGADGIGSPGGASDVSMEIREGEVHGIAGLLGSGRTETAEMLFGVRRVTSGGIRVRGEAVGLKDPRTAIDRKIAFCPEDRKRDGVIGDLTVRENIMLALQASRGIFKVMPRAEQEALADKFIEAFGIVTPDAEKKVGELSGGNQQKVILARWMAMEPDLLILDEPTRGIDVGAKAEIQRMVLEMCEGGKSAIFISSELDEVIRCSNRITVMRDRKKAGEVDAASCTQADILSIVAGGEHG